MFTLSWQQSFKSDFLPTLNQYCKSAYQRLNGYTLKDIGNAYSIPH